ncbi:putative sterigmatocystin biosynthesis cytochrome P450 monooxygenase [Aspergillus clavatus NRRL 1]|uniref:Benzoate 4-monooxygenase cytochrome P450 n=1 Tax=Aspergillus clavatus (strain ATCC 1007 / CBS 513.65 / DSM 816 / NCTC 3887 / NRRL 1 / QM 1276 / 107) TaxID=344612 RepID=A1CCN8_ASPCL|nr:benzoate 4-monooxygenase cytochrome P450 [Aspergillus clavatus NRRL 1]EAW12295.1 benzoate 4-monooxygenase cytochrome P450 [Aspergillus clavatus NRRL 1]
MLHLRERAAIANVTGVVSVLYSARSVIKRAGSFPDVGHDPKYRAVLLDLIVKMFLALGTALALYLGYILASAIRNIYFHPLRDIPGPKSWIAFPLLQHLSAIRGRLDLDMHHWHIKYGAAVRFDPTSVSFITADAWRDIYGHGHKQLPKVLNSGSNTQDIISANDADHTRHRKALAHAFSAKGLQAQEPIVTGYVDQLIARLRDVAASGLPADMVKWYTLTTFDLIGDLAFGEPFGGLESSEYHRWVAAVFGFIRVIPFLKGMDEYSVLFRVILSFLPRSFLQMRTDQVEHTKRTVQKRLRTRRHDRSDFMDSMLRHRGDKDGLSEEELVANANILIIAGSETTATLLSGVTYWLLQTPAAMERVTREVRTTFASEAEITFNNVTAQLPYMLACISEAFRLYPPVPGGLQRWTETPTRISGYEIPGRTKVSVHQAGAYWSSRNFHQPDSFIPDRWLPEAKDDPASSFFSDQRDVLQPFSVGPRNCIGKNLAYTEMRVILARVLYNFDLQLCEESRDWKDQKTFVLWEKKPLMCRLTARRE